MHCSRTHNQDNPQKNTRAKHRNTSFGDSVLRLTTTVIQPCIRQHSTSRPPDFMYNSKGCYVITHETVQHQLEMSRYNFPHRASSMKIQSEISQSFFLLCGLLNKHLITAAKNSTTHLSQLYHVPQRLSTPKIKTYNLWLYWAVSLPLLNIGPRSPLGHDLPTQQPTTVGLRRHVQNGTTTSALHLQALSRFVCIHSSSLVRQQSLQQEETGPG